MDRDHPRGLLLSTPVLGVSAVKWGECLRFRLVGNEREFPVLDLKWLALNRLRILRRLFCAWLLFVNSLHVNDI